VKVLLAVISCEKFKDRADACRQTWVPQVGDRADVKFCLAKQDRYPLADEWFLDCDDSYQALPAKVHAMVARALANRYDYVCKLDDDCLVRPDNLLAELPSADFVGHVNAPDEASPCGWVSGPGYWLSEKSMYHILLAEPDCSTGEDRWVSAVLNRQGIYPVDDKNIYPAAVSPRINAVHPHTKICSEFSPVELLAAHKGPSGWQQRAAMRREWETRKRMQAASPIRRGDGSLFF